MQLNDSNFKEPEIERQQHEIILNADDASHFLLLFFFLIQI
jgi:hypothetical protein